MKKLRASDKVTVKYSREGLTERNLSDKTETVISNKRADISFGKHRGSEFDIRSHADENARSARKSPFCFTSVKRESADQKNRGISCEFLLKKSRPCSPDNRANRAA